MTVEIMKEDAVFVIYWKYSDGQAGGAVKVYREKQRAESDLKMLREHCEATRTFELTEVPFMDEWST